MKNAKTYMLILCINLLHASHAITSDFDSTKAEISNQQISDPENTLIYTSELLRLSLEQDKDQEYLNSATEEELLDLRTISAEKDCTLVVFMAANNDLYRFALKNIVQMEAVGSNQNINIIVQLHTPGANNPTKRYVIKKGKRLLVPAEGPALTTKLDSGDPETLIDCVEWAMKYYPAKNLIVNFWNHGSGCWDPGVLKTISTYDLFYMNSETNLLELDRSIEFIEHIEEQNNYNQNEAKKNQDAFDDNDYLESEKRGICFDETYKSYMSNQDLKYALAQIQNRILGGKKIAAVWFDACLMSMIEITNICKDHADYFMGSQDVEYASGSNYQLALSPFIDRSLSPKEFACHIVHSFEKAYQNITRDFTQSAIDLSLTGAIEENIELIAQQLVTAMQHQTNKSVFKMIQQSKSRPACTCFEEPSFIDIRHLYINLQANLGQINLNDKAKEATIKAELKVLLEKGINAINRAVIANTTGSNLSHACGISIYFPERNIFHSYPICSFARSNSWMNLLIQYLQQAR